MPSRPIHAVANGRISSFFKAELYSIVWSLTKCSDYSRKKERKRKAGSQGERKRERKKEGRERERKKGKKEGGRGGRKERGGREGRKGRKKDKETLVMMDIFITGIVVMAT